MKIIKRGIPLQKTYRAECPQCKSVLEMTEHEFNTENHICPVCPSHVSLKFIAFGSWVNKVACSICYNLNCDNPGGKH